MINPNGPRTGRPPTHAPHGVVATPHYLASAAGVQMLQRGGSAVDAAIAANAVLCVAYPHMAGLGGDGFWLIAEPGTGTVHGLNASGPSARLATLDYYRSRAKDGAIPMRGPLSVLTVPGALDGWRMAHERFGRLAWHDLFDPAIIYARDGVPVSRSLADWTVHDVPILSAYPATAAIFMPGTLTSIPYTALPFTLSGVSRRLAGVPISLKSRGSLRSTLSGTGRVAAVSTSAP